MMHRLFALLLLAVSQTAPAENHDSTLVVTGSEWPPYVSTQLYKNGVAVALTEEALQRAGYTPRFSAVEWPASLEGTVSGDYDVITSVWRTDKRAEELEFSEPFLTNEIVFTTRDDRYFPFNELADLQGLRIGVVDDYAYSNEPYDTTGIEISSAGSSRDNILLLLNKQLDLVLADSRVALYEIDQLVAAKQLSIIRKPLTSRGMRIAVSKKHPDHQQIIAGFNKAIAAMQEDGSYNAIMATFRITE